MIAPVKINFFDSVVSLIAVALGSGAAGALNMWYESDLDSVMTRTCLRPIPTGKLTRNQALSFGVLSSFLSVIVLYFFSNFVAALTLVITILFYVFVYTIWLKRKTSQNIVIGGAAGALPPIIGWAIATNEISLEPIILFLIIFVWTPSHFWALSLYKSDDYRKAKIPMLPITSGIKTTKLNILIYALMLFPIALAPFLPQLELNPRTLTRREKLNLHFQLRLNSQFDPDPVLPLPVPLTVAVRTAKALRLRLRHPHLRTSLLITLR